MKLSLKAKMILAISSLVVLISLFQVIYFPQHGKNIALQGFYRSVKDLTELIAFGVGMGLEFEQKQACRDAFAGASKNKQLRYILVIDDQEEIFVSFQKEKADLEPPYKMVKKPVLWERKNLLNISVPVWSNEKIIGTIIAGFSLTEIKDQAQRDLWRAILMSLLVLVLGLVFANYLGRRISSPILEVTNAAHAIASDDLQHHKLSINSQDEIGSMALSFNKMQDNLINLYQQAQIIALGDLSSPKLFSESSGDLGSTFARMVASLKNLALQADAIERGDFNAQILAEKTEGDLGKSFARMIASLQKLALQADAIERGDFNAQILTEKIEGNLGESFSKMVISLKKMARQANIIQRGDFQNPLLKEIVIGELGQVLHNLATSLNEATEDNLRHNWLITGQIQLNEQMRGDLNLDIFAERVITFLSQYLEAQIGAFYLLVNDYLRLAGNYAGNKKVSLNQRITLGDGLVGQAALEQKMITASDLPEDYLQITSGIGEASPRYLVVFPVTYENQITGVIELGFFQPIEYAKIELLNLVMENITVCARSTQARIKTVDLLEETQRQTEELQTSNDQLAEKSRQLTLRKQEADAKNLELERARKDLENTAIKLEQANKYKSEFLANMSHELRTPLNSMLLITYNMAKNMEGNLTKRQLEWVNIIQSSGNDLLNLINEILDLARIEAGKMVINFHSVSISQLMKSLTNTFKLTAQQKNVQFITNIHPDIPTDIITDRKRLEQILINLLANAFKFTQQGQVKIDLSPLPKEVKFFRKDLSWKNIMSISISDTGIGIPTDKRDLIFKAFQQVEEGTSKRYGGTGLGLSISKELSELLGGEIHLESQEGEGSIFTIYLPFKPTKMPDKPEDDLQKIKMITKIEDQQAEIPKAEHTFNGNHQLKNHDINGDQKRILVIEKNIELARWLGEKCQERGYKYLEASTGEEGIMLTSRYELAGVIIDLHLPGMNGQAVLGNLKEDVKTRHIPVYLISEQELDKEKEEKERLLSLQNGALGFASGPWQEAKIDDLLDQIVKSISQKSNQVLLVEDNRNLRRAIVEVISMEGIVIKEVDSGEKALENIRQEPFDCIILDLGLPDISGLELLRRLEKEENLFVPPIVVYTGRDLSRKDEMELRHFSDSIIIKGVKSQKRLLDEVSKFLHLKVDRMPDNQQRIITQLHNEYRELVDTKVLLVDDDMRNLIILSNLLQDSGIKVFEVADGQQGLDTLDREEIDLMIVDIMMPIMDGYQVITKVREQKRFKNLPIIALTAKAMDEDREKCLQAGANEYLAKPVDMEKLFAIMRRLTNG